VSQATFQMRWRLLAWPALPMHSRVSLMQAVHAPVSLSRVQVVTLYAVLTLALVWPVPPTQSRVLMQQSHL
jgi:hypothetical protein